MHGDCIARYAVEVTIHRFHCASLQVGVIELDPDESRHALTSLRLRAGDCAELFDGAGRLAIGELLEESGERGRHRGGRTARLAVKEIRCEPPPASEFTLLTAAPKGPRLDWLIEKCTELNVSAIQFVEFERSVVRLSESAAANHRRATIEASKQCGRLWLPELTAGEPFRVAVEKFAGTLGICDLSPSACTFAGWLSAQRGKSRIGVIVGPEGGVTPGELAWMTERNITPVRLAPTVLRVETAAIMATAAWACGNCDASPP